MKPHRHNKEGRIVQLGDICDTETASAERAGSKVFTLVFALSIANQLVMWLLVLVITEWHCNQGFHNTAKISVH